MSEPPAGTGALRLERPLVFLDTETTGADPSIDRVVQIALVKLHPDGRVEEYDRLVNPGVPIPAEASEIHGITDAMVEFAPPFKRIAGEVAAFWQQSDLAGFNLLRFDLPLLRNEFQRCGEPWNVEDAMVVDAQKIFHAREPRDLSAAVRFYCGHELEGAHGAMADTRATMAVVLAQLERYADLPRDVSGLNELYNQPDAQFVDRSRKFRWSDGEPVVNFGSQQRGGKLSELILTPEGRGFLRWILDRDFSAEVKGIVERALNEGIIPTFDSRTRQRGTRQVDVPRDGRERPRGTARNASDPAAAGKGSSSPASPPAGSSPTNAKPASPASQVRKAGEEPPAAGGSQARLPF